MAESSSPKQPAPFQGAIREDDKLRWRAFGLHRLDSGAGSAARYTFWWLTASRQGELSLTVELLIEVCAARSQTNSERQPHLRRERLPVVTSYLRREIVIRTGWPESRKVEI